MQFAFPFRFSRKALLAAATACLFLSAPARGETVLAVGGLAVQGRIVELDSAGRLVVEPARQGAAVRVALADAVEIVYAPPADDGARQGAAPRTVLFRNGDRLEGDVTGLADDTLALLSPRLGKLSAPLGAVRGWRHDRGGVSRAVAAKADALLKADAEANVDLLLLANGDSARGAVLGLAAGQLRFKHLALDKEVAVDPHDVIALRLARLGPADAADVGVVAVVHMQDGSRLSGRLAAATTEKLQLAWLGGQAVTIPVREIERVNFHGGRLVWLSDLTPAGRAETPLLGPPFTLAVDRAGGGGELSVGGRTFRRGLATRSRSQYTWKLDRTYAAFECHVGLDDEAGGAGSVVFRVLVDGKERFNSGPVRGGRPPAYVRVELAGAKELTLAVDEADELDLGDHADWAEAHLILAGPDVQRRGTEERRDREE